VAAKCSGSTACGVKSAASAIFRHAVRDLGAIDRNPCRDLERGDLPSTKRTSEPRYLSVDEVERLLAKLSDESRPVAAACFFGGLRISEAISLRWSDIDFEAKAIGVRGTKTEASTATIPLLPALARELAAHRERQGRQGFERIRQESPVFVTASGRPPSRRNLLRAVQSAAKRAGLVQEGQEPVGCHDLRQSLAANAFGLGLGPTEVARLLRHANPRVTLSIYAGLTDDAVSELGGKLAAMGGAS
jgi:integrase